MEGIRPLKIGELLVERPVIQGGMGVGISLSSLAGAVAKAGGLGIISTAQIGFREPDFRENPLKANLRAIGSELNRAREIAPEGVIGFNIMVATRNYEEYVKAAVKAGADIIISGAGLPVSLPEYVREAEGKAGDLAAKLKTKLAPIVSSLKSVSVICRLWERKYQTTPDMVVIEGPLAGGHLGFSREQLAELEADTENPDITFHKSVYEEEVRSIIGFVRELGKKHDKQIPVVTAGGIYTHEDVMRQFELGADGVQVATRFVTTQECDAPDAYKQAYIQARAEDIVITKSPVGMPGRAIRNAFLRQVETERKPPKHCYQCLEHCEQAVIPYCITDALVQAALGNTEQALLFCGSNAYRADRIETVPEVMENLIGD